MTEEIKEMLHCIEMNCKHNKCFGGVKLDEEDCKLLLDYITNLQQLYENALKVNQNENKYRTELESKYVLLQQTLHNITINGVEEENTTVLDLINENKKLKECYCNRTDCTGRIKDSKKYDSVYQEKEDYKSRCEKANTYINEEIKKIQEHQYSTGVRRLKKIQNILNRSDEK